jgi:hypothetical protein
MLHVDLGIESKIGVPPTVCRFSNYLAHSHEGANDASMIAPSRLSAGGKSEGD